jgi:hypothetical protein
VKVASALGDAPSESDSKKPSDADPRGDLFETATEVDFSAEPTEGD